MKNELLTKNYEGQEVAFRINKATGESEVRINEVAKFCGWINMSKGKEYVNWTRVNGHLKTLGCAEVQNGNFIPEYIMYPLIGKANNDKATKFMLWVGQVLTQLRTKGVVILESANDEAIDFEKKFGKYRIRKTFTNSKNEVEDYKQFKELSKEEWKSKRLNNIERVKLSNIIVSSLENKINSNVLELKPSRIIGIQEVINDVKTDIVKLSNKKNGGDKAVQTKLIKELQEQLDTYKEKIIEYEDIIDDIDPDISKFNIINCHALTVNRLYDDKIINGQATRVRSVAYKTHLKYFPFYELDGFEDIDFNKPINLHLSFDMVEGHDLDNMIKATQDIIFNYYGANDNVVCKLHVSVHERVNRYEDGKIYFYMSNEEDC